MAGRPKGGPKYGGRQPGSPNKTTLEARQAIALFVDSNAHRLTEWLDSVAEGTHNGKPDPAKAFELFQSVVEYHVPKLNRTEHAGELTIKKSASDMTDDELAAIARAKS